jgi:hypothetical protein
MSEKVFAFLLSLHPHGFREKYLQEAMLLYRDRYRYETGYIRRVRLWCDLLADLVTSLPRTWQTSWPVVAVPSESPIAKGPSFHLLHSEPLRPTVILVSGVFTLGAACAFTFVLNAVFLHPIQSHTMSPIESVMNQVNQTALPEVGNRALPIDSVAGSITSLAVQTGAHGEAITAGVDVVRPHAGNAIRKKQAQNLPHARRSRNAEQRQVMLESHFPKDRREILTSNVGSTVQAAKSSSLGYGQQSENEGLARPTARETYVRLPLAEVQHLFSGDCATIRASHEFPGQITNAFATITHTQPFALVDPGAGFNVTGRRLMLAGRCQDRWFIEYEHGGAAKSVALMVLRANPDKSVTFIWGRQLKNSAGDLAQLRAVLANSAFWDGPYSW